MMELGCFHQEGNCMLDEFNVFVYEQLLNAGLSAEEKISLPSDPKSFGNAQSIWRIDNICLRFLKDRGQFFLDLSSVYDESNYFVFDDVALLLGWQDIDQIMNVTEPLKISYALSLIKSDLIKLNKIFSKNQLELTFKKLSEISEIKCKESFL